MEPRSKNLIFKENQDMNKTGLEGNKDGEKNSKNPYEGYALKRIHFYIKLKLKKDLST